MFEDVVCNRKLDRSRVTWKSTYHGERYYFCSLACHEQFELEPEDYRPAGDLVPAPVALIGLIG